jgi:hypothetical protein
MGGGMAGDAKDQDDRSLVVQDSDDRSERMLDDPERYFAEARRRAEREVRNEAQRRAHKPERDTRPE